MSAAASPLLVESPPCVKKGTGWRLGEPGWGGEQQLIRHLRTRETRQGKSEVALIRVVCRRFGQGICEVLDESVVQRQDPASQRRRGKNSRGCFGRNVEKS